MKLAVLLVCLVGSIAAAEAGQRDRAARGTTATSASSPIADAYTQYLLAHRLERDDDVDGAIAAYKRAIALDPASADPQAELAGLYMRQNRVSEAMTNAEASLKIDVENAEAHRVLGTIYAALSDSDTRNTRGRTAAQADENAAKAIDHLQRALVQTVGEGDPNLRAALGRMYVRTSAFDKAIPILRDLVEKERGWQDGGRMCHERERNSAQKRGTCRHIVAPTALRLRTDGALGAAIVRAKASPLGVSL